MERHNADNIDTIIQYKDNNNNCNINSYVNIERKKTKPI